MLQSPFIDDRFLLLNYGLVRSEEQEFWAVYRALPFEDRPPLTPFFDSLWYAKTYSVEPYGDDALSHFLDVGFDARLSPHPLIQLAFVEERWGSLGYGSAGLSALIQILTQASVAPSPYFNLAYYTEQQPGSLDHPSGPFGHFLEKCIVEDENAVIPCELFDAEFYRERYPDVPRARGKAFLHFVATGDGERRFPSALFDPDWYFRAHPDLVKAEVKPLRHYLIHGEAEGRAAKSKRSFGVSGGAAGAPQAAFVPTLYSERGKYREVKQAIAQAREAKRAMIPEIDARPVSIDDPMGALGRLSIPRSDTPRVSIIIPVYNELQVTVECLASIEKANISIDIEVIVTDDCSPDERIQHLKSVKGVRYMRTAKNLNFLRNCNAAFKACKGEYILLLNNDAQVCEGCIEALVDALDFNQDVGIAGPKFLFPNGLLQEAGCTINRDATSTMIGLFKRRDDPAYSFSRDVDYVSGAALLVRRSLVGDELFDDDLAPAYCEDLELCLRVRAQGFSIRYVAEACVVHHLSVTMSDHGRKMQNIITNQQKVLEKWQPLLEEINRVRTIAFFLPQYHPIPENDLWWGKGFTEWTNVSKAAPSYQGHYQPHLPSDLGFYDLRLPQTFVHQASLVQRYGLEGLCFYYYNFGGKTFLEQPIEVLLAHPEIPLKFCFCWANENWSRRWDGGTRDLLLEQLYDEATLGSIVQDLCRAARDERYIRVNGRPLFMIYRPLMVPNIAAVTAAMRRQAAELGEPELHMVFVESMESVEAGKSPGELGFEASVEFPPHGLGAPAQDERQVLKPGWAGHRYDYVETIKMAMQRPSVPWKRYPAVFPSWDNTARQPLFGTSFDNCSPDLFQLYVEEKADESKEHFFGEERLLFVNAWNEWAEGAHLEPDVAFGHRWLFSLERALGK